MKTLIKNVNVVTASEVIPTSAVLIEDGKICSIGTVDTSAKKVVDGKGGYLIPGFIDMHCHGGIELDFIDATAEEMQKIASFHLSHGTTTMLATTLTASEKTTENCLKTFAEYKKDNPDGTLLGVHMEGPWFSPKQCGAQDVSNMKTPSKAEIERIKQAYPFVLRVSCAPELDGGMEFGKRAKELGVIASVGHTDADFDTVCLAHENGYELMTHFYSSMKGTERVNLYRVAGAVEAGYYLDDMNVEIIADGRHLPDSLLKLIYKIKGVDKISLITDATRGCGLENGTEAFIGPKEDAMPIVIENDVALLKDKSSFAGSTATFDRLYKVMANVIGKDFVSLSKMASLNPARLLGLKDRGEIKVGKRADLIIVNDSLEIQNIFHKGEEVK